MNVQEPIRERNRDSTTKGEHMFEPFWFMAQCLKLQKVAKNQPISNTDMLESLAKFMNNKVHKPTKSHSKGESKRRYKGPRTLSCDYRKPVKESNHHKQMFALMMTNDEKKRYKIPLFPEDSNARDWKTHKVEPVVRSISQAMAIVLATNREFTLEADEIEDVSEKLTPFYELKEGGQDLIPTTKENVYERLITQSNAESREWFRLNIRSRQIKYREANSQLWGLIEVACDANPEVRGFIQTTLAEFSPEELQNLKGNWLLAEIVRRFHRDTQASLSTKLTEFHSMTLNAKYRNAHAFLIALENAGRELVTLRGIDSDKLLELLTCRLIAGIKHRYEALAHSIELKRTEAGGISWDTVKSLVRTIEIDTNSTKRPREQESREEFRSPKRFLGRCSFCNMFGHKAEVCKLRLGTRETPEKAKGESKVKDNSAMKASTFRKSPGNFKRATYSKTTTPPRIRCYRCGGPHYQSDCKVSVASVKHAKELTLPEGYFIPEDLQAEVVASPEKVALMMSSLPSDGRLDYVEKNIKELCEEVKSTAMDIYENLEIIVSWNLRVEFLKAKLKLISTSTTSQMRRKSFVECKVNKVESILSNIQENIFHGLQIQMEDLMKCEAISETMEKDEEEKYYTLPSCIYNATASLPPFVELTRPRKGLGDRLPVHLESTLISDAGAAKHPLNEREKDISEMSLKHSLFENEEVSEMTLESLEEPNWVSFENYVGMVDQHTVDWETSMNAKLETDKFRSSKSWKPIRDRIATLTDEEIESLSEIIHPHHYNGITRLSKYQRLYCSPEELPRSIYGRYRCMNYNNNLTTSDCILLQELGLPPIVVNRLKNNEPSEKLALKIEFTSLRIQSREENATELQDVSGFKVKAPRQKARLLMLTTADSTIDYKVPEFVKESVVNDEDDDDDDDDDLPTLVEDDDDDDVSLFNFNDKDDDDSCPGLIYDDTDSDDDDSSESSMPELLNDSDSDDDESLSATKQGGDKENLCFPAFRNNENEDDTIIDSGCSQTAVNDEKMFCFVRKRKQAVNTVGPTVEVELSGPIGPFADVFLIPILTHNLVSIKDLNDLGVTVSFEDGLMVMESNGLQIMRIASKGDVWTCNFSELCEKVLSSIPEKRKQQMWWLQAKRAMVNTRSSIQKERVTGRTIDPENVEQASIDVAETEEELIDDDMIRSEERSKLIRLWHLRLCHRSENLIVKDVNSGRLNIGVERLGKKDLPVNKCACCMKAKSHKLPRSARPVARASMTIEKKVVNPEYDPNNDKQQGFGSGIVSTDSCGPYTVPSLLSGFVGNQNFMLMDSKMVFTYGYVRKDAETTTKNLKHLLDVEMRKLDLKVKRYHSDGAKELSGKDVTDMLEKRGITKTISTPYSAQENAFIERHFGMETEASIAMLMYARFLPKSLWFLAKEHYTHTYNMMCTQTARGRMSPHEYVHGDIPDVRYLRVFGSKCWVNIPLSRRQKDFKARALSGYLVGYTEIYRNAYKVWIPEWNRIVISRDVRFDEEIPQGIIDFKKDEYWLEVREFGHLISGKPRGVDDFKYLIGEVFYDPEMESHFRVLNVTVNRGNIVAGYAKYIPEKIDQNDAQIAQMHVANVEQLLCPIEGEQIVSMQCSIESDFQRGGRDNPVHGENDMGTPIPTQGLTIGMHVDRPSASLPYQFRIQERIDLPAVSDKESNICYAYVTTYINDLAILEPSTYGEAVDGSHRKQWLLAIAEELESLRVKGVLELISINGMNMSGKRIGSRFIFKVKMKHGKVDKFKCRLVAKGYTQRANIDYSETFSPVARMNTLRIFLKISIDRGHHRVSIDFKTAFLNATLNEELYLLPIEGMDCPEGFVYRLKRAIYGLKQAGRSWSTILAEFLTMQGLKQCTSEPCVFYATDIIVIVYVDDVIISSLHRETGENLIKEIEKVFEIGEVGPLDWYLGISFDDKGSSMRLSQKDYVEKMLTKYQVDTSYEEDTPMNEKTKLIKDSSDELFHEFDLKGKIGSLMYLSVCTRPDICYAVSSIARMSNHPSKQVCTAVNYLFAYLNKNRDVGLLFKKENDSEVVAWSDSDYAGDPNDYKSTSGVVVFIGCLIICWYCSKQSTTAQSSTDAEAISMNFATKEVVWIRGFLKELGMDLELPTRMKGDNLAAIMLSRNPMFHKRTKHIIVKIAYMQEMVKESVTLWEHIGTNDNIADMFTKALPRLKFLEMVKKLMLDNPR